MMMMMMMICHSR